MKSFLEIIDSDDDVHYVNPSMIISIRPGDGKNFRDSGAEIKVLDGDDARRYYTQPGKATNIVVQWLGLD